MTDHRFTRVALAGLLVLLVCAVVIGGAQNAGPTGTQPSRPPSTEPIYDYQGSGRGNTDATTNSTANEGDKRRAKSGFYDRPNSLPIKEEPESIPLPLSSHWWLHLPALPVAQSNAIAVGVITDSRAFLSNDKHAVYSEFSLQVEQILKDGTGSIGNGAVVTTTRSGGIVQFPSGRTQAYRVSRQGWPATGSRYVLFLHKNQSGDFDIVTGYELRDGEAEPLDGTDGSGSLPFQQYAGVAELKLLDAIRTALANSTPGEHNL